MKKIVCAMLCILLVFSLSACGGNVNEVNTHNVESEIYSEEDIATAIDTIKKEFKSDIAASIECNYRIHDCIQRKLW